MVMGEMRRALLVTLALVVALPAGAGAKTIHFGGETVTAPDAWPVIRLARRPHACVRLDRRAVYLGRPGASQRCPAGAIGRRRAILVDPGAKARAARARAEASRVRPAHLSAASDYTGLGFDACAAPSSRAMSAWSSSPYRAIGVYVGGVNRGCSQPNLTASWVAAQVAAGWSLIPTYVGLQAPTSSCSSCARLSAGAAALQGAQAAEDAVNAARLAGIGEGSPIYFDMESYSRTASASNATLTFLEAWTTRLRALGYDAGVYSSSSSGIADLASRLGGLYQQPDDLWFANWNGHANALDPYVPASAWADHQRIHQYRGGHDETYGGVAINVDNNYVEGATAGTGSSSEDPRGYLDSVSSPGPGQVTVSGWAFDPSAPRKAVSIRAYVGGGSGTDATSYELGPIAGAEHGGLAALYPRAGADHGFEASFPIVGSGRQRICVYALDIGAGSDKLLGCRDVGVPVPIALLRAKAGGNAVRLRLRCEWPVGTECPGQIIVRARLPKRFVIRRHGRRKVRTRIVRLAIARRRFHLVGGRAHTFRVGLGRAGRRLARLTRHGGGATASGAHLLIAIPGGRVGQKLSLP
jgi:Rv2525c-like, glycoside hydrolase-like domain